jgi:hypothetical protein
VSTVVFIFTNQGEEGVTPPGLQADATFVAHRLGATTLLSRGGVTAYVWHPGARTPPLVLPTTSTSGPSAAHP